MRGLAPNLVTWSDQAPWSGRPGATFTRAGFAVISGSAGLVFIDPPPLTDAQAERLEALGVATHVLLTSRHHDRAAGALKDRWGCRILCHPLGRQGGELQVDGTFRPGRRLFETIEPLHLAGFRPPEETAFLLHGPRPALIIGDAVCGPREDVGIPPGQLGLFSRDVIDDAAAARRSLLRCLRQRPVLIAFGHGEPLTADASGALERFLARQDVWGELAEAGAARP